MLSNAFGGLMSDVSSTFAQYHRPAPPQHRPSSPWTDERIERLKELFPTRDFDPALADEFNDATAREMERVRDFIILHYKLTQRDDTPFWVHCRDMPVPPTLERKMGLWDARGEFIRYRWEMFHPASWLAMYAGFDRVPRALNPALAAIPEDMATNGMARIRQVIDREVTNAPSHQAFLDKVHG